MRIDLLVFVLSILVIIACAPAPTPIEEPPGTDEQPASTEVPADLTPAQLAAITAFSESLGLSAEQIKIVSTEAVDWPDGCLGVQEEGIACTDVITPGFRIILEAAGRQVEYHTNEDGTHVRPATLLMTWKREGGIAGFCDSMTVYLSGEVHVYSCKQGQYVEQRLSDVLSQEEMAQLDQWVQSYGNVNIDASDPKGVSDRMVVVLTFAGLGSDQTVTSSEQKELVNFAQQLHEKSNLSLK